MQAPEDEGVAGQQPSEVSGVVAEAAAGGDVSSDPRAARRRQDDDLHGAPVTTPPARPRRPDGRRGPRTRPAPWNPIR